MTAKYLVKYFWVINEYSRKDFSYFRSSTKDYKICRRRPPPWHQLACLVTSQDQTQACQTRPVVTWSSAPVSTVSTVTRCHCRCPARITKSMAAPSQSNSPPYPAPTKACLIINNLKTLHCFYINQEHFTLCFYTKHY